MSDRFHDECGVFGIIDHPDAANMAYLGLYALQHRGQESAGIASMSTSRVASEANVGPASISDGTGQRLIAEGETQIHSERDMGYVADIFSAERLSRLPGDAAIGHVRYSTAGGSLLRNAQPLVASTAKGPIAIAHNGNLVNGGELRRELEKAGSIFNSMSDSEVIVHLFARARSDDPEEAFAESISQLKGAWSIAAMIPGRILAARDPMGFRPLVLGRVDDALCIASETCAFDLIGATTIRQVHAGEIVAIDCASKGRVGEERIRTIDLQTSDREARCIFEHVYFSRPDSTIFGENVGDVRKRFGARLAREHPVVADVVVPVPDSGVFSAIGYAQESGIPFEFGLVRNHYVGRTFIEPRQSIRNFGVKVKLNPVREIVRGRKVILLDDSIVRGTTSKKIVAMLKSAGAIEVHMRISSPPTTGPCYYGIDTPRRTELIASKMSVEQIREFIGADSLGYLSAEQMLEAVRTETEEPEKKWCTACFTGRYPIPVEPSIGSERELSGVEV